MKIRLLVSIGVMVLGCELASSPLFAACECTLLASASQPTWSFTATSSGACVKRTALVVHRDGLEVGFRDCGLATTCTLSEPRSSACLRTGVHTVTLGCFCGKNATDSAGNPFCDVDTGSDDTTFSVNTTPTVSLSITGPDNTGAAAFSAPYSFPNTTRSADRQVTLYADGNDRGSIFPAGVSGTWTGPLLTDCWRQGSHEIKVRAKACNSVDPAYQAEAQAPLIVNHMPEVSLGVAPAGPPEPPGSYVATVGWNFPQTRSSTQRFLTLRAYPSGSIVGEWNPSRVGTWRPVVSCNGGAKRLLVATAFACSDTQDKAQAALPDCPKPPRFHPCKNQCGCVGGAGPPAGPPGFALPGSGPGAQLSYLGGGVGSPGNPGRIAWIATLGRNWSHDYAEKIVADASVAGRVWLLTRDASFVRFTDTNADGLYETVAPEDEDRTLASVATGWELRDLDGTVQSFDGSGRWTATRDRNGNTKTATYASWRLVAVTMPDGRREDFGYNAAGKLASITEVGVGGAVTRIWGYRWTGDDLVAIERPDGIELRFAYGDSRHPGLMTRSTLVGADDADPGSPRPERVERAWDYDAEGNVLRTWRGPEDFASGVDRVEFAYDNPFEPEETTVTFHRSATEGDTVVYTLSRTAQWVGAKARITSISGNCSSCGLGPNAQLFYDDPANPLLPTRTIDGRGHETLMSYDANGRLVEKVEAAGTPESRTTSFAYDPTFPALPTRIEVPSTSGGAALRTTVIGYDAAGNPTSRRIQGVEAGSFFDLETITTFNAAGQPLAINPPGYGTDDRASFTYDSLRGDLLPLTRTDPLVGTTSFAYEPFNRQTETTDPNELTTVTAYDALGRVLTVTQEGTTPAEDLVTHHEYNALGDLVRTTLPRGNVVEYGYDTAGRLVSVERKPDAETPGERAVYTLDGAGNRVREDLQRWDGEGWTTESFTESVYANRCQVQKVVHADGTATESAYDCGGNLEKVWDANHPSASQTAPATQVYTYDALDRLTSVSQPWTGAGGGNAVTSYGYDVQDHLAAVTDSEGNLTTYTTSDRDLLTRQVSPVSGTSTSTYNEHGELLTTTDARAIVATRGVDAAGRVTQETFGPAGSPDPTLTTTYAYGSTPAQFDAGRLTGITRNGQTIGYTYDRFGRVLQDGALTYEVDKNGNRTRTTYPGGVAAIATYDFADREATLSVEDSGGSQPLVTSASYKAFGPLAALSFANGLAETRLFDARYFPDRLQAGALLDWDYTVDAVGNPTAITGSIAGTPYSATFAYQDPLYFLTEGDGPWGDRAWTYDKIGNRLSFAKSSEPTLSYAYAGTGHNPKLSTVTPAPGWGSGAWSFTYDAAGNQTQIQESNDEGPVQTTLYDVDADGRMKALHTGGAGSSRTDFLYDGRGFLREAHLTVTPSGDSTRTMPAYSSDGVLMARTEERQWTGATTGGDGEDLVTTVSVFYFAGRPVAQLTTGPELLYLTTDHLGTPVLATDGSGAAVWAGGVEPFGAAWTAGPDNPDPEPSTSGSLRSTSEAAFSHLSSERVFLRYPGQWDDPSFQSHGLRGGLYYNVHRWYSTSTGRYTQADPLGLEPGLPSGIDHLYLYVLSRPVLFTDPLGLFEVDPSCDECLGEDVGTPSQPTKRGKLIMEVHRACTRTLDRITDLRLRRCIEISCNEGTIECRDNCPPDKAGHNPFTFFGVTDRDPYICVNNWSKIEPYLGDLLIHEWAHGCHWGHWGGKGIPGNSGEGFD